MNPLLLFLNNEKRTEKIILWQNLRWQKLYIFIENIRVTEYNIEGTLDVLWRIIIHEFSNNSRVCKDMEYITKKGCNLL